MGDVTAANAGRELQLLEDIEAIKRLKYDYCYWGDVWPNQTNSPDKQAALFAEDGVWDVVPPLRSVGPKAIAAALNGMTGFFHTILHIVMSPRIDVNGDSATGTWYLVCPCTPASKPETQPAWLIGQYHEKYVRTAAGWRYQLMAYKGQFSADFLSSSPAANVAAARK
jgi:hypothetical protein